jgi:polysaccharide export outer membrane protein
MGLIAGVRFLVVSATALLAACSALPTSGPDTSAVVAEQATEGDLGGFVLVDMDERVTSICAAQPKNSLRRVFHNQQPAPDLRVGVGDIVTVTIWEAAAGGLFSASIGTAGITAGARTAVLPEQVVARDGNITIPYAGRVKVVGLRPAQVEAEIVRKLQGKAIEPQAIVTIAKNLSNTVTVTGEVTNGAVLPLSVKGDRLLSVIAAAGGLHFPAYESFVRLTRGNRTATVAFTRILADPSENIYVRPNDVVTVVRTPQTFTVFGGTAQNASVPFGQSTLTLEEAIAKSGGLSNERADPSGVFLLRFEPTALVHELAPDRQLPSEGNMVPVVYQLNMRMANSYFLARSFEMKNKDILYIANAPSDTLNKALRIILPVLSALKGGVTIAN